jgi:hypothetical protein
MNRDKEPFTQGGQQLKEADHRSSSRKLRRLVRKVRSLNLFYILSGIAQVVLGSVVTLVAILNLVHPLWLAAALSLLGCVVTMLGVYQVYEVFNSRRSVSDLARDAIERAINDKN